MAPAYARNSTLSTSARTSPWSTCQNSAKLTPAITMNGMITHWTTAPNAAMLSAFVEKPPVGSVEKP